MPNFADNQELRKKMSEYKIVDVSLVRNPVDSWIQNMARSGQQGWPDPPRKMLIYEYRITYKNIIGEEYWNTLARDREPGKVAGNGYVPQNEIAGVMTSDSEIFKFLTGAFSNRDPLTIVEIQKKLEEKRKELQFALNIEQPPNALEQPPNRFKKSKKKHAQKSKTKKKKSKKINKTSKRKTPRTIKPVV